MPEFIYRTRFTRRQGPGRRFRIFPETGLIESEDGTLRWMLFRRIGQPGGPPFSTTELFARLTPQAITRLDVNNAGNIFLRADIHDTAYGVTRVVFLLLPA